MAYPAVPDHRIPYDNDGSVLYTRAPAGTPVDFGLGPTTLITQPQALEFNDTDHVATGAAGLVGGFGNTVYCWVFFPEQREVTALFFGPVEGQGLWQPAGPTNFVVQGSNDTTNGMDGTWETASLSSNFAVAYALDDWRAAIKTVSFTGGKKALRLCVWGFNFMATWAVMHLYGEKVAGQTPDDLIFIDHDTTPGVEYATLEDFGDRPLGTTVVRQFRVKNVSPTLTANNINLQCNDPDFAISTDGVVWVVTINIASLAAGAESATMFIKNTTPAIGSPIGPDFARIVAIVGSYS